MPIEKILIAIPLMALIIFATRAFPFILFSHKEPPRILLFIEKYIPPMIMAILLVYCLSSVSFMVSPYGIPEFLAIIFVVVIHLWKNNAMISIFGGTILYMILIRLL